MANAEIEEFAEKKIIRRAPSVVSKISELKEGTRACIAGTVVSRNPEVSGFVIDDGNASIMVLMENSAEYEKVKEGMFVRVFGKVWGSGQDAELQADIVQDFSKVDKELYKKVFGI